MGQIACPVQSGQSKVWAGQQCHRGEIIGAKLLQNVKTCFVRIWTFQNCSEVLLDYFLIFARASLLWKRWKQMIGIFFWSFLNADHRLGSASHGQLKTYKYDTPCNKDSILFLIWSVLSFQIIKKEKNKRFGLFNGSCRRSKNDISHFFFFFSCDINMWQPLITEMQFSWKKSLTNQFDVKHFQKRV